MRFTWILRHVPIFFFTQLKNEFTVKKQSPIGEKNSVGNSVKKQSSSNWGNWFWLGAICCCQKNASWCVKEFFSMSFLKKLLEKPWSYSNSHVHRSELLLIFTPLSIDKQKSSLVRSIGAYSNFLFWKVNSNFN